MSVQLVIAEKPSVARSIAGVIGADQKRDGYMEGNGYLVSWCIGHLVSLADAGAYDERFKKWRYDDLPILPQEWQYIIPAEKKGQFSVLRSLMERPDVTGLVCATDAGREGELIFRFVYQMAGCGGRLRQPVSIGPVPGAGRLAGGDQRHPAFLHPLSQDPDRGPCPDAYPQYAG